MKACVIQTEYSGDPAQAPRIFAKELELLEACDESMDVIVLPEYSNIPGSAQTREQLLKTYREYDERLREQVIRTARRCQAIVFVNGITPTAEGGYRNSTVAYDREGRLVGRYDKQHLIPAEMEAYGLDKDYTYEPSEPTVIEIEGVRYAFLICYDCYFYELYANIARQDPDVMIVCAYQRSDTHSALTVNAQFCAYNTNTHLLRASVSLGADSETGGTSMIVAPDATVLASFENEVGLLTAEFDPHAHYLKPAGFGNPPATHHSYIEAGRRPWKYRPGGSGICKNNRLMSYPRVCAHRGFSTVAPENSMAAFGAAIALGADEIEFDLTPTLDGEIVSIHDPVLERVSNGSGYVWEHTLAELKQLDFGSKFSDKFKGLQIITFEEILRQFAGRVVMNVHVKSTRSEQKECDDEIARKIIRLIERYDCADYVYFMTEQDELQEQFARLAPHIERCMGEHPDKHWQIVDRAIAAGCTKVQLYKPFFDQAMIDKAHEHGILCNVFWSDEPEETKRYLAMGIDTILSNEFYQNYLVK